MTAGTQHAARGWTRIDRAAFGLVYGAITVLGILLAIGAHPAAPFETAAILFGSVLAVTLAKAFAELMAHALDTGERMTRQSWRAAWAHSSPTLAAANLPALFFLGAGLGWLSLDAAAQLSQWVAIGLLVIVGLRVGWVLDRRAASAILGGLFAGGVGLTLALLKFVFH